MSAVQDHAGQAGWGAGGQAEVKMGVRDRQCGQGQPSERAAGRMAGILASEVGCCGRCCWTPVQDMSFLLALNGI